MRGFRVAYTLLLIALLVVTFNLGLNTYYPTPKKAAYPKSPTYPTQPTYPTTTDYMSAQYQEQYKKYQEDLKKYDEETKKYSEEIKAYDERSKEAEKEMRLWSSRSYTYALYGAAGLLVASLILLKVSPLVSTALMFTAVLLVVFGKTFLTGTSFYAGYFMGRVEEPPVELADIAKRQFYIAAGASVVALLAGLFRPLLYPEEQTKRLEVVEETPPVVRVNRTSRKGRAR